MKKEWYVNPAFLLFAVAGMILTYVYSTPAFHECPLLLASFEQARPLIGCLI